MAPLRTGLNIMNFAPPYLWKRHSVIVPPMADGSGWTRHCQMPTPLHLSDGSIRLYYTARSPSNKSHVLFVDIADRAPFAVLSRPETACLTPGQVGYFDAEGVMPTSVIRKGDEVWLYYIGWSMRADVPYHNGIGLARSTNGGETFQRVFNGPIVGTSNIDPLFVSTAEVCQDGSDWVMYYASTTEWRKLDDKMEPRYHLRIARSRDAKNWTPTGRVAVDFRNEKEAAVARATVLSTGDKRHMWFCARDWEGYRDRPDASYRLGYAVSNDGNNWQRVPEGTEIFSNQFPEDIAFDKIMQAYPAVFDGPEGPLLFFNGDGFGQTGIAVATVDEVSGS